MSVKKKIQHTILLHNAVLLCILLGGLSTFFMASGNKPLQIYTGLVLAVSYVAWGIISHAMDGSLHRNIVIEYVLIGAIACVVLVTIAL